MATMYVSNPKGRARKVKARRSSSSKPKARRYNPTMRSADAPSYKDMSPFQRQYLYSSLPSKPADVGLYGGTFDLSDIIGASALVQQEKTVAKSKSKSKKAKGERSAAQKAATRKMLAANKAARASGKASKKRTSSAVKWDKTRRAAQGIRTDARNLPSKKAKRTPAARKRAKATAGRIKQRASAIYRLNPLTISNPLGNIPVIGPAIAMIGPAFFGAIGVEAIGQLHVLASKFGVEVPEMLQPFTYTIGGLLIAGIVQTLTFLPPTVRFSLGLATASAGGAVDAYRYRNAQGAYGALELGDAGRWEVVVNPGNEAASETGALELGALELGALELGDFSGDAEACADDFSSEEGRILADEGYGAFHRRFIRPLGQEVHHKPHLRRKVKGAQWLWLAKKITPAGMKELANMAPNSRLHYIAEAKADEIRHVIQQGVRIAHPRPMITEVPGIVDNNTPGTFATDWSGGWGPTLAGA